MESEKIQLCADAELPPEVFNLPPSLQDAFFRAANQLMQKEAETFLDILSSSRSDLSSADSPSLSPARSLRSPYLPRRDSDNENTRPVTADYERAAIDNYLRQVGREQTMPITSISKKVRPSTSVPSYARPVTAAVRPQTTDARPGTSHRIRLNEKAPLEHEISLDELSLDSVKPKTMLNLDDKAEDIRREQEELLHQMESQGKYISEERRRQAELVREKKEEVRDKKLKVANIAETLIVQGRQADEKQSTNRLHQIRLLQERLEKKRFQRRKSLMNMSSDADSGSVEEEIVLT